MADKPKLGYGEQLVTRLDSRGNVVYSVQKVSGRTFAESDTTKGYTTDAPLMMLTLAQMDIPQTWMRTWCTLVGFQQMSGKAPRRAPLGMVKTTHRDISAASGVSRTYVGESLLFFNEIGWLRTARRSVYQLNPFLTFAGSSADQEAAQNVWAAEVPEFLMPGPEYAAAWRKERREEQRSVAKAANVVVLGSAKTETNEMPAAASKVRAVRSA
ncbi:hypothetical protein ACFV6F_17565 [Kitasatospora phosalacinea]|uniref:hypothetical protein n=1 Tax=Kitasatospora phosalacinea TaxID=2065 RepID=UPI0036570725